MNKTDMIYWISNDAARRRKIRQTWSDLSREDPASFPPGVLLQLRACAFELIAGDKIHGRG